MNGLDKIIEGILNEALSEADRVTGEARSEAEDILSNAREHAEKIIGDAKILSGSKYKSIIERAKSDGEVTGKRILLQKKKEIIDDILSAGRDRIIGLDDKGYFKYMHRLFDKYATGKSGKMILSKRDKARIGKDFVKAVEEKGFIISDEIRSIDGGFVLVYGDVEENCSIESLMESEKEKLYDIVNSLLF